MEQDYSFYNILSEISLFMTMPVSNKNQRPFPREQDLLRLSTCFFGPPHPFLPYLPSSVFLVRQY